MQCTSNFMRSTLWAGMGVFMRSVEKAQGVREEQAFTLDGCS